MEENPYRDHKYCPCASSWKMPGTHKGQGKQRICDKCHLPRKPKA